MLENQEERNKGMKRQAQELIDQAYQRGLKDAWEAARKICAPTYHGGLPSDVVESIFGEMWSFDTISHNYTAPEAIAKIKAYEEQKNAEEEGMTTFEKIVEYVRDGVRYFTFKCQKCGGLARYRFLEDGKYANFCDQCGNKIVNMPFFDSECEINEAEDEIKVGDEVIPISEAVVLNPSKGVVVCERTTTNQRVKVMWNDGSSGCWKKNDLQKTGRHFSEIAEVLKQMGEE